MMSRVHRATCVCFGSILFVSHCVTSFLIIPDEWPTFLQLIYSKIPPLRKGTDSRLGVGFRLGQHADFQILLELGPQQRTDLIGNNIDSKKKRTIVLNTANKMELVTQKRERKLEFKSKFNGVKAKVTEQPNEERPKEKPKVKSDGSEWLLKWRQGMVGNPSDSANSNSPNEKPIKTITQQVTRMKVVKIPSNVTSRKSNDDFNFLKMLFGIA